MAKVRDREITEVISKNIKRLRLLKGLTQKQLQEKAGWRYQAMVSQLEKGTTGVGPQTLRKLAQALEVDPSEFYKAGVDATAGEPRRLDVGSLSESTKEDVSALSSEVSQYGLHFEARVVYDLRSLLVKEPSERYGLGKVAVPSLAAGIEGEDLVYTRIGHERVSAPIEKGDIVCIACNRKPVLGQHEPNALYAVRLEDDVGIGRLDPKGHHLVLSGQVVDGEDPVVVDLRAHPSAVIGRIIWIFRTLLPK